MERKVDATKAALDRGMNSFFSSNVASLDMLFRPDTSPHSFRSEQYVAFFSQINIDELVYRSWVAIHSFSTSVSISKQ